MRAAFILNPAAKSGRARGRRDDVLRAAQAAGIAAHLVETARAGEEAALAAELSRRFETVVAVGGDGTVQGVASGLAGTGATLGVVPMGTGNDFAAALGMPRRVDDAVRALASAPVATVDLGRVRWTDSAVPGVVHERLFTNCLGAGFDALAALGAARTKWLGGRSAYLAAVLHGLWLWRRPVVSATVTTSDAPRAPGDDRLHDPAGVLRFEGPLFLCEVGNGHSVGGGFLLTPEARIDDGALDVCTARHMRPARALRILPTAFAGAHVRFPEIGMARAARVCIRATAGALPVQADGEALSDAATAVDAEVWPGALQVLRPAH